MDAQDTRVDVREVEELDAVVASGLVTRPAEDGFVRLTRLAATALRARDAWVALDGADPGGGVEGRAVLAVPLRSDAGDVLGALYVADHPDRVWSEFDEEVLEGLAESVLDELRLRATAERERRARAEAEEVGSWLEFLLSASAVLNDSLDYEETLDSAAQLAVEHRVADWCGIDLLQEGVAAHRLTLVTGRGGGQRDQRVRTTYALPARGGSGIGTVLATGEPRLWSSLDARDRERLATQDRHLGLLAEVGVRSLVLVPLIARGRTLGVMSFALVGGRAYEPRHVGYLGELARRAALAVDNARLYRERDRVARTLQASLLPPSLPVVEHLQLAARYTASGEGNLVGGDFYDVFETGHGWVLVMGDVRGKGAAAAAMTGLARHAIRAAAVPHRLPSRILRVLNEVLLSQASGDDDAAERFATVACGLLVPREDGALLTVASAGHPLPLLVRADGRVEAVGRAGTLVGLFEQAPCTDVQVSLDRGDRLVLYTDGVTEARHADGPLFGEERLVAVLRSCAGRSPAELVDQVERAVVAHAGGVLRDDLGLLAAGVPD